MPRSLLLYGSNTGNTAFAAEVIAEQLERDGIKVTVCNVAYAKPEDVLGNQLLILGASTWGAERGGRVKEGQMQDQMADFLDMIKDLKLSQTTIAIFGLGDSAYTYFCGAAVQLEKFVQQVGSPTVIEPLYLDGLPQRQVPLLQDWASNLAAACNR